MPRPTGAERLDAILVINLARRVDRLTAFDAEMKRLKIPSYTRFEAIEREVGILGCTLSHAACVRQIIDRSLSCAMICEDDAQFLVTREELDVLVEAFLDDEQAEVACLAYKNLGPPAPWNRLYLRAPQPTVTASCYLVKHGIAAKLADCLEEGAQQLAQGGDREIFGNDEIWTRLQQSHVFVIPIKRAARQADDYSDVERRVVSHGGV